MSNLPWDTIGSWPMRALLAGGAVLLVGRLVVALTRQPARRAWVGTAAVVAALLAIPLSFVPGWVRVAVPVEPVAIPALLEPETELALADGVLAFEPPVAVPPSGGFHQVPPEGGTPAPVDRPEPPAAAAYDQPAAIANTDWTAFVAWAYGLIVVGLLLRLAVGHWALVRLWRKAQPAPASAEEAFRRLAGPVCPRAELRVSANPVGPVCFGTVRPRVLVPAGLLATGDGPALRAVFAHELAHLGRRDPLAGWLLGLARAAYFACPWLAGLRREVRLAQECLADAHAARQAADPTEYAELLIRLARSRPAPLGAAGARGPSSELYWRVTMLLQSPGGVERRCPRRWTLAVGGGLTALAVLAAGLSIEPRTAAAAEPEKKAADKADPPKKEPAKKEAAPADPLKDALERLKKDLGDDPETKKMLDELFDQLRKPSGAGLVAPILPEIRPPAAGHLEIEQEIMQAQELMQRYLQEMMKQGRGPLVARPDMIRPFSSGGVRLGVRVERPSDVLASQLDLPAGQGLVCTDVPADSVAGKAGIKPNDILMEVGGKPVPSNFADFQKVLADVKPDAAVDVVVMRKGKKETIKGVKLPEAKPVPDFPALREFPLPPVALPVPDIAFPPPPDPLAKPDIRIGPGETARVEQVNDAFTVFYQKNGVKVTIAGTKEGGTPKAESIEVDDNGKTTKAESIDKLPKEYQELAKNALKAVK